MTGPGGALPELPADRALYGISVASELTGVNPQMLRAYEARGLVTPYRTAGGTRRYSDDDVERIRHIGELLDAGLNFVGIKRVLEMELELERLRTELHDAHASRDRRGDA